MYAAVAVDNTSLILFFSKETKVMKCFWLTSMDPNLEKNEQSTEVLFCRSWSNSSILAQYILLFFGMKTKFFFEHKKTKYIMIVVDL